MNTLRKKIVVLFFFSCLLCGCGKSDTRALAYEPQRLEEMLEQSAQQADSFPTFASGLCIADGEDDADFEVTAEAAALFSLADKQVISEKAVFERMNPASITKLMTALLVLEADALEDVVTVGEEAVITESGASLCHINPGDTLTMEQLLYGLMLPSGNDAAATIAVHMAGSIEAFAERMNAEAKRLGATDTHFVNPHGFTDPEHYTTVYDLYLIFQEALTYPKFREIIQTTSYEASYQDASGNPKTQNWSNSNRYLTGEVETPEGLLVLGGKTGTTKAAGYCLIMGSQDENEQEYISVVLKSSSRSDLYQNMTKIIQKIVN